MDNLVYIFLFWAVVTMLIALLFSTVVEFVGISLASFFTAFFLFVFGIITLFIADVLKRKRCDEKDLVSCVPVSDLQFVRGLALSEIRKSKDSKVLNEVLKFIKTVDKQLGLSSKDKKKVN